MLGKKFGRWTVIESAGRRGKDNRPFWKCRCDCGTEREVDSHNLGHGSKSCGCLQKERAAQAQTIHGLEGHPVHKAWWRMKMRCENPKNKDFKHYGGRGIKICERWRDPKSFYEDMLPSWRVGLSLDRINVNGNYEPNNCAWVTQKQQTRNKRTNVMLDTPWGRICATDAAERIGISPSAFYERLRRTWDGDRLFLPKQRA